jgi:hypothetical protein
MQYVSPFVSRQIIKSVHPGGKEKGLPLKIINLVVVVLQKGEVKDLM